MKNHKVKRVPILYLLLVILISVSVLPLGFYAWTIISGNREKLEVQESIFQTNTSRRLAREISLYAENVQQRLNEYFEELIPLAESLDGSQYGSDARLRNALELFINESPTMLYVTVLNYEARGVQAGGYDAGHDTFLRKELEAAFIAVKQGTQYQSDPITIVRENRSEPVIVYARGLTARGEFHGMVGAVVTLGGILEPLEDIRRTGLEAFIIDNAGRQVAHNIADKNVPGKDMASSPIVQEFLRWGGSAQATGTSAYYVHENGENVQMLGTYSPVQNVNWGVIVQRPARDAYFTIEEMRDDSVRLSILVILLSLGVAVLAAKFVTRPLDSLTETARSIAHRDFTQRADAGSTIREVAEVAEVLNSASEEIQQHIGDLKTALDENRQKSIENLQLFMESIDMIAAAVDAKDPYTKGHSKRVSQYSVVLANELGLPEDEIDKIRISATLHDVGKIGIEDRVLKKPGVLTNEEFEIMKRHPVMGFEIVRQVKQLTEMLPGIRWHHEALNGKGYPDGISGDELPIMVRIIAVSDTFDAITTDRPYQAGRDFPAALEILRKHAGTRYDPLIVDAMHAAYGKGSLSTFEVRRKTIETVAQPAG